MSDEPQGREGVDLDESYSYDLGALHMESQNRSGTVGCVYIGNLDEGNVERQWLAIVHTKRLLEWARLALTVFGNTFVPLSVAYNSDPQTPPIVNLGNPDRNQGRVASVACADVRAEDDDAMLNALESFEMLGRDDNDHTDMSTLWHCFERFEEEEEEEEEENDE
jgi:hypothetical protein